MIHRSRMCLVALAAGWLIAAPAFALDADAVDRAIKRGMDFLFKTQKPDGSWGEFGKPGKGAHNYHKTGQSALCCYALLESGINPQDPRILKALNWIRAYKGEDGTYSLGLRCNVWHLANVQTRGKYRNELKLDAGKLIRSSIRGAYGYKCPPHGKRWDNSNSQYGVLGLWAAAMDRLEVDRRYWDLVRRHWEGCQQRDGGWGYTAKGPSTAAMVTGGVATLFVAYDALYSERFSGCGGTRDLYVRTKKGLDWLDKNFSATLRNQKMGHSDLYYYLYGVERAALASGYKYFGNVDWYKEGATRLLKSQSNQGSWNGKWGPQVATSFALVFLLRGRNAVIMNKLEFEGDWNNRPRDLANLTNWMSRTFERAVNWQIINTKRPVSEWHDAPILYISASRAPQFKDDELTKLRTFVLQGGTIFSACECGGTSGFRKGIREVYEKLFPEHKLVEIPKGHDIYTRRVHFDLPSRPRFYQISNGVRPLVIHTDEDLPLAWQARLMVSKKWAFEAAFNVIRYVTDRVSLVRPRGTTHWPEPYKGGLGKTVKLVRLKHEANCNPEPLAFERFARLMAHRTKTRVDVTGPIPITDLTSSGAKVATLTGTGTLDLSDKDKAALKEWVEKQGGTLVIDAAGGDRDFERSAEKILKEIWGVFKVRRLSSSANLLKAPKHEITSVKYRRRTGIRLSSDQPNLKGVVLNGRTAVVLSGEDITAGLVGYTSYAVDGYDPESAFALMRNAVLIAK